ncbi:MAG TPA: ABC transporter ATP-binding protein, partial [Steroidobacteraceae bacterium]|nr:ABC transporter ATP-binding protein [Steroidobacteraceae bacterium]
MTPLLAVRDLKTHFFTVDGITRAVDGVSFDVFPGETLGIVGESGCGKSVTCLTIMGLNPKKNTITSGEALWKGQDLLTMKASALRQIRGSEISMIFQDPMTSLNPVHTIGRQLEEAILLHRDVTKKSARARSLELLKAVGIPRAEQRIDDYPHQFSGGMRQRVMIAMALINDPDLLIADEPTTALDVSIQAQVIALLKRLAREHGTAVMLITHDMGVIAETADRVAVMYAGRLAELGPVREVIHQPRHPYTAGLMGSIPKLGAGAGKHRAPLVQIVGSMPRLNAVPSGCAFHPRCEKCFARC